MTGTNGDGMPLRIEEITPQWITGALQIRAPGVAVEYVDVVDIINGTCTKIRLRLGRDARAKAAGIPETVILKGGFESHSREMSHVHLSEVIGYRDIFPLVPLQTPKCFYADYDAERLQGIVIMEDLIAAGVEFCSALKPQTFDQVARRLIALARFHSQTWASPDLEGGGRWASLPETEVYLRAYMNQYLLKPEEWARFVASPRGAAASIRYHDLDRIIEAFDHLTALSQNLPHCIIHGDTHLNNLYIYPDGSPGFFDALPGRAPGMKEVSYHLTCALDTADRRRWEAPLVQIYLDELSRNSVTPPSFDEAIRQFGLFLLDGYIIFIVNESFYQPESVNTAYTARFNLAMIDHQTLGRLLDEGADG